ncbi:MAG: hypothetical protein HQL41_12815, partial [Alphaproteobacteria bacterium]|nr:hypothetical protein [Alphaproteobacteria bacterium]
MREARRLNDEGHHDLALDRLAPLVFAAVADDPPSLAEPVRELLEECCFDYLIAISNRVGLTPDWKRPTERWVRAIHHKLPRERRADECPRLAVLAVMHLFNMLAHEAELAEEFPAWRAAAGVFAVARLAIAERYHEVLALERHADAWIDAVRGEDPDIVALSRLRLLRDRLTACDVLRRDRAADGTLRAALAFRDSHPAAWKMIAVELLSGHARHLARIGRGADALEWIDRAIVDAHDEDDRASAQAVRMDLRREILGETSDLPDHG